MLWDWYCFWCVISLEISWWEEDGFTLGGGSFGLQILLLKCQVPGLKIEIPQILFLYLFYTSNLEESLLPETNSQTPLKISQFGSQIRIWSHYLSTHWRTSMTHQLPSGCAWQPPVFSAPPRRSSSRRKISNSTSQACFSVALSCQPLTMNQPKVSPALQNDGKGIKG